MATMVPLGGCQKEETESTWIIDKPAWEEQRVQYIYVCDQCGEDITEDVKADENKHFKESTESGKNCISCHKETLTDVVLHPEEGHWEIIKQTNEKYTVVEMVFIGTLWLAPLLICWILGRWKGRNEKKVK